MSMTIFQSKYLGHKRLAHSFFGRDGGVSKGLYEGLNCGQGSRDNQADVQENRRIIANHFGTTPERICTVYQIHSAKVVPVFSPTNITHRADAMVTTMPGLLLGILTADCAPVLLADAEAGVIGAVHAGWKGAHAGIIENTIQAMLLMGARRKRIAAAIGPCIAQASYEVGPEFIATLMKQDHLNAAFFAPSPRDTHAQFDLQGYVMSRVRASGLQDISAIAMDTCSNERQFFSYRRATLRAEPDYGRQISCIMLKE